MGASEWVYVVRYQPDLQLALDELRADVFRRGAYANARGDRGSLRFEQWAPYASALSIARQRELRAHFAALQRHQSPRSIAEALDWAGADGTHSVLDVETVVAEPFDLPWDRRAAQLPASVPFRIDPAELRNEILMRCGKVAPCSEQQLLQLFGTTTPTRAAVEAAAAGLLDLIGRGEGRYVVTYHAGHPAEIVFAGCSGD